MDNLKIPSKNNLITIFLVISNEEPMKNENNP